MWASVRPAGGPWGAPEPISGPVGRYLPIYPTAEFDPYGNLTAVWYHNGIVYAGRPAGRGRLGSSGSHLCRRRHYARIRIDGGQCARCLGT
jgi:hypothetical protein